MTPRTRVSRTLSASEVPASTPAESTISFPPEPSDEPIDTAAFDETEQEQADAPVPEQPKPEKQFEEAPRGVRDRIADLKKLEFQDVMRSITRAEWEDMAGYLYRLKPEVKSMVKYNYICVYQEPIDIERIRQDWGGGNYKLMLTHKRMRNGHIKDYFFDIDGEPKSPGPNHQYVSYTPPNVPAGQAAARPGAGTTSDIVDLVKVTLAQSGIGHQQIESLLEAQKMGMKNMMDLYHEMMKQNLIPKDGTATLIPILLKMLDRQQTPAPSVDPMAMMNQAFTLAEKLMSKANPATATPAQDPIAMLDKVVAMVDRVKGLTGGEDAPAPGRSGWMVEIAKSLPAVMGNLASIAQGFFANRIQLAQIQARQQANGQIVPPVNPGNSRLVPQLPAPQPAQPQSEAQPATPSAATASEGELPQGFAGTRRPQPQPVPVNHGSQATPAEPRPEPAEMIPVVPGVNDLNPDALVAAVRSAWEQDFDGSAVTLSLRVTAPMAIPAIREFCSNRDLLMVMAAAHPLLDGIANNPDNTLPCTCRYDTGASPDEAHECLGCNGGEADGACNCPQAWPHFLDEFLDSLAQADQELKEMQDMEQHPEPTPA